MSLASLLYQKYVRERRWPLVTMADVQLVIITILITILGSVPGSTREHSGTVPISDWLEVVPAGIILDNLFTFVLRKMCDNIHVSARIGMCRVLQ